MLADFHEHLLPYPQINTSLEGVMDMCSPKTISVYEKTIPQRASIDEYYTLPLHLEVKRLAALCR